MSTFPPSRSKSSSSQWEYGPASSHVSWPLRMVDLGFLGLILLLPFIWGGRQALGNLTTVLLSGWTALWWSIYQLKQDRPRWKFSGAEPLLLLAILLVVLQTLTLPESIKNRISPQINQLLPAWSDNPETSVGLGHWSTLSFAPWQTWSDLITLMSVMLVFFIAVQRLSTLNDVHRLLKFVAISGGVTAMFGLVQYLTGNGKFYWFYDHPDTSPGFAAKAAFTNANHFADFLAMSMPAQLWWYFIDSRAINKLRAARNLNHPAPTGWRGFIQEWPGAILLGITCTAILLSQSRGGLLIMGWGMAFACLLFWKQKLLDSQVVFWLLGIAVCGAAAMMAFGGRLDQKLSADIEKITEGNVKEVDNEGAREKIWNTDLKVVQDFPAMGTGLGTHSLVYETYHDHPADGAIYSHAENGYIQIAMEAGITGLLIALGLICLVAYWCIRGFLQTVRPEIQAPLVVASSILTINLIHSCTDFIWYVPGCMVIVVLAAASACVLYRLSLPKLPVTETHEPRTGRLAWGVMLAFVLVGLGWGIQVKWPEVAAEPYYHEYKRLANSRHASDDLASTNYEITAILNAAQANPHDPVLQQRAARAHIRNFLLAHQVDHDLLMEEIRQAAMASDYPNRAALNAWLDIPDVMGENRRHLNRAQAASLRAMRLCPLEPRPYVESAKLAWLSLAPTVVEERLMQQALAARPFDGQVYLEYAHFLNNQGQNTASIPYYQEAYRRDARCRTAIITDLSPHYPPSFFLNTFELDLVTLIQIRKAFSGTHDINGYRSVLQALAQQQLKESERTSGEKSALHIVAAAGCFTELGDDQRAIATMLGAIQRHSNSYHLRSSLAGWLFDHGRYSEALPHLEWCHRRRPEEQVFVKRIEIASTRSDRPLQMAEQPESSHRYR